MDRLVRAMGKPKVAFICVHNALHAARNGVQALGRLLASDVFRRLLGRNETESHIRF